MGSNGNTKVLLDRGRAGTVKPRRMALATLRVVVSAIFLLLVRTVASPAETNGKQFDRISIEQGLSQTTVYCILQDARGFMWFGTRDGLNKYDGYDFTIYKQEPDNPHSLSNNTVRALYEDRSGTLWVGTDGGLNRFDRAEDRFTRYQADPENPRSLSSDRVRAITEDLSGALWIGTYGGGLNKIVPIAGSSPADSDQDSSPTFVHYQNDPSDPASLSHNSVYALHVDRVGMLWVGTIGGGLNQFVPAESAFIRYRHDPNDSASLSHDEVNVIYQDRSAALWIGTRGGGLNRVIWSAQSPSAGDQEAQSPRFEHYRNEPNDPSSLGHDNVDAIYEDESGTLWIGTYGGGLSEIIPSRPNDKSGKSEVDDTRSVLAFAHYRHDPLDPGSLSHDLVRSIYEDRSGVLWIGTSEGGINQYDRKKRKFAHYESEPNNPNSLSTSSVSSIYEDRRGDVWVGTYGDGLNKLVPGDDDGSDPSFLHFRHDPDDPQSLSSDVVYSIVQDRSGVMWLGTIDGGLNRFVPPPPGSDGQASQTPPAFTHYRHDPDDSQSLSHDRVVSILERRDETRRELWLGTYGGLNRLDLETGLFSRYQHDPSDPASLSHDEINVVFEDRSEVIWVGTRGGGLNRFDREQGFFTRYLHDASDPRSLSHNEVNAIHESRHGEPGVLWIGTHGGLNKLVSSTTRLGEGPGTISFGHYGERDGLPNAAVLGILEDDDGNLWLSTYRGISKFDPLSATFKNYDVEEGLQSNEFNIGAYHRGASGRMFFGGINGFNAFYPANLKDDHGAPRIAITDFQIFNQPVGIANRRGLAHSEDGDGLDSTLPQHISETSAIRLSYRESVFSFEFAALHYSRPAKKRYAYKMEGFDEDWVDSGPRRFATYTNLDPGGYVFRVKASNRDGVWSEEEAAIDIVITPPIWKTWWFRSLAVATILFLVFSGYKRRVRNIELQKERLEIQVEEKTREIRETQDQLVQSEKLAALGRLTAGIAHEINTPIGAIKSNADIAARCVAKLEEILGESKGLEDDDGYRRFLDVLKENNRVSLSASDRISNLVNNLKAFSRLDEAPFAKCDIHKGLDSAYALIRHEIRDEIEVAKEYGELPEIYCYASELNQVFMTLLRNAIEAIEGEGRVTLKTSVDKNKVRVEISDSGKGIPKERLTTLFDFSFTTNGATVGLGMDLVNAYNIVQNHRGELKAETDVGGGSTFTIILPTDLETNLPRKERRPEAKA